MKTFPFLYIIILTYFNPISAQEPTSAYPEGIYSTKEDFIAKTPSSKIELVKKGTEDLNNKLVDDETHSCFFFEKTKDSKVRKVFAIVYHGSLYFRVGSIMKYCKKGDGSEYYPLENVFVKVILEGKNYIYTEAIFANVYTKTAFNTGVPISASKIYKLDRMKGVIWDLKKQEFDIFKDCQDYNEFIKDKSSEDIQKCESPLPDKSEIREVIKKLNS